MSDVWRSLAARLPAAYLRLCYFSHHAQSHLMRAIPTIPAVFAGNVPHPVRRLAQDIPASQVLRKDWQSAICAVEAHIPRYARARPVGCRDCTPPAASTESGEMAGRPAVLAVAWAGMAVLCACCAPYACYAPRTYSASLRFIRSSQSLRFPCS